MDLQDPKSYPINTGSEFYEIKKKITNLAKTVENETRKSPPAPPPTCFSKLIPEVTIKRVYEQQNDGNYEDALRQAGEYDKTSLSKWRKIWRAIDEAYQIEHFGIVVARKPRIHFLHRNLLEIAKMTGLDDLKHEGIVEFLDDICPCGKTHKTDALRKLRKRMFGKYPPFGNRAPSISEIRYLNT